MKMNLNSILGARLLPGVVLITVSLLGPSLPACAAEQTPAELSSAATELKALVTQIQTKVKDGKKTEADLADDIKEFDALLAKHRDEKTDDAAEILFMKAVLYQEVLDNPAKCVELAKQTQQDFPNTKAARQADAMLDSIQKQEEAKQKREAANKIRQTLVAGAAFPDFQEQDLAGKPLAVANYKGKVVLLDFWATWCGPCVHELPNVLKTYEKHHDQGFEIIGISLDQDEQKLKEFIKDKSMVWRQYFDGKLWANKLAVRYGVQSIPATYLLDGEGKIIGQNLRGDDLEGAVAKALEKN